MVPFAITNSANCQVIAYDASRIARILCCACIVTNYSHKLDGNGILLFQGNLPRVTQVVFQMYSNFMLVFLSPISIFNLCLWGMVKLSVLNIFGMYYTGQVHYSDSCCKMHQKEKEQAMISLQGMADESLS